MKPTATFGLDLDRVGSAEPLWTRLRRRMTGRFPVDAFGADPMLQDGVAGIVSWSGHLDVIGGDALPEIGPAVLVCGQGLGGSAALAVVQAVRQVVRRRARVVGYPDLPVVGGLARRLGAVRARPDDLAAVLAAGHLAVVPLAGRRRLGGDRHAADLMTGALGHPVIPVAVTGGRGFPGSVIPRVRRVVVGAPLEPVPVEGDRLSAAELAEAAAGALAALARRD